MTSQDTALRGRRHLRVSVAMEAMERTFCYISSKRLPGRERDDRQEEELDNKGPAAIACCRAVTTTRRHGSNMHGHVMVRKPLT